MAESSMKKRSRSRITHQSSANARLRHARRPSADAVSSHSPGKSSQRAIHLLIAGFVLLQVVTLLAALTLTRSAEPQSNDPDVVTALEIPWAVEPQPELPEPPAPDFPPTQKITESYILEVPHPDPVTIPKPTPLPEPIVLRLRGVEITQGIQVFNEPEDSRCHPDPDHANHVFCNNSIPMVAGRHTLLRVYLACNGECPAIESFVRLRLLKDGQEQASLSRQLSPETLQRVSNLPTQQLRLNLNNSVNFEFFPPPFWLSGQVTFEVEAMAYAEAKKPSASLSLTKHFAVRKPLRVAYMPIEYQGLRPPEPTDVDYWMLRMYPVSEVEYYRLPVPDLIWEGDVSKGEVLRKLLYTYWLYAQYQPIEARPDQLFGWLPMELFNGGVSDPFWCPNCVGPHSSRVAFGGLRPEQDIGGPRILVHEIAHNFGAQHAWSPTYQEDAACFKAEGVDIRVDPDWPYAQTPHIQEVGIDLYSNPPVVYPPSFYDMMAYCIQPWISPHTYRKIFNSPFLQPDEATPLPMANFQPQVEASNAGTLLVSGVVYLDGTVSRPEIIQLEGDAFANAAGGFTPPLEFTPPPGDDYCLDVQASDDAILARHCFDVGFLDLETGLPAESSPFFLTLPNINPEDVAKVSISKDKTVAVVVTPSNTPPEVTITFPNGGEVLNGQQTFTWDAYDADDDPLLYDLLYSPDGGQSWLPLAIRLAETNYTFYTSQVPASNNGLIRVIASDGFHTATDESNASLTIEPPLENSVSLLGPATVKPGQTFEVTVVANQVSEPGLFGVQFKLNFDPGLVQVDHIRIHPALELVVDETIQNDIGQVSLVASRQGRVSNLTGQVTLATLRLTAGQSEGQLYLDLDDVVAGARGGLPMTISEIQGLSLRIAE